MFEYCRAPSTLDLGPLMGMQDKESGGRETFEWPLHGVSPPSLDVLYEAGCCTGHQSGLAFASMSFPARCYN